MGQGLKAVGLCLLLAAPLASHSAMVSVVAEGIISSQSGTPVFPDAVVGVTPFSVRYTFDSAVPDNNTDPNIGFYPGAIQSVILTVGSVVVALPVYGTPSQRSVSALNDLWKSGYPFDTYMDSYVFNFDSYPDFAAPDPRDTSFSLHLTSEGTLSPSGLLTSDGIFPLGDLSQANQQPFFFYQVGRNEVQPDGSIETTNGKIAGHIQSIQAVPLPATAWLLLSGLGGLGFIGRRRKAA